MLDINSCLSSRALSGTRMTLSDKKVAISDREDESLELGRNLEIWSKSSNATRHLLATSKFIQLCENMWKTELRYQVLLILSSSSSAYSVPHVLCHVLGEAGGYSDVDLAGGGLQKVGKLRGKNCLDNVRLDCVYRLPFRRRLPIRGAARVRLRRWCSTSGRRRS